MFTSGKQYKHSWAGKSWEAVIYESNVVALYLVEELIVKFMAVIKNVFVCRVQACFHAVLHHHAGSWWTLELLYLHRHKYSVRFRVRCSPWPYNCLYWTTGVFPTVLIQSMAVVGVHAHEGHSHGQKILRDRHTAILWQPGRFTMLYLQMCDSEWKTTRRRENCIACHLPETMTCDYVGSKVFMDDSASMRQIALHI